MADFESKLGKRIKLIAFDLDGVLVDGRGSWTFVHEALGTTELTKSSEKAFFSGEITFEEWAKRDAELWRGIEIERIKNILYDAELMPGIEDTLTELKNKRYRLVIISGGLKILADRLKDMFGFDHVIANELLVKNGKVSGMKHIIGMDGKGKALERVSKSFGFTGNNCAAVGDFINDIPMFKYSSFSIAFNPKTKEVEKHADAVIYEKNLKRILDYF